MDSPNEPHCFLVGASGAVGAAVAEELAAHGASLHLGYRHMSPRLADWLAHDAVAAGSSKVTTAPCDLSSSASLAAWLEGGVSAHGRIDVLISCVGITVEPRPFVAQDPGDWTPILEAELFSVLRLLQGAVPVMVAQGPGRIVLLSSDSARTGAIGHVVSSAARGGVNALTRSLARELGRHGIVVNTVCPGPVDGTALTALREAPGGGRIVDAIVEAIPIKRPSSLSEVAAAFRFLALDEAAAFTGQAFSVSGGLSMA